MAPLELLNVPAAAAYLGVSTGTIYALTAAGKLGHFRSGQGRGTIRYSRDDLDAYVASNHVEPSPLPGRPEPAKVPFTPQPLRRVQPKTLKKRGGR